MLDKPLLFRQEKNSILLYHKKHAVDYGTATSITNNIRVMPYMSVSRTYRYSVFYSVPILNSLYYRPDFGQVSKSKLTHDLDLLVEAGYFKGNSFILELAYCEYERFCNVCGLSIFCLVIKPGNCCCFSSC